VPSLWYLAFPWSNETLLVAILPKMEVFFFRVAAGSVCSFSCLLMGEALLLIDTNTNSAVSVFVKRLRGGNCCPNFVGRSVHHYFSQFRIQARGKSHGQFSFHVITQRIISNVGFIARKMFRKVATEKSEKKEKWIHGPSRKSRNTKLIP
jgi:hypothetical protein